MSVRYKTVTAAVPVVDLHRVATLPGVRSVTEVLTPMTAGLQPAALPLFAAATCHGAATSEGDAQLRANVARSTYNVDGTGTKVGILSDSFDQWVSAPTHATTDVASGDLPGPGNPCGRTTPVQVVDDSVAGEDEGRAMAQIVHDLAPGAALAFATAFASETSFADNIVALKNAGAKVIADDVTYFDEPFFQDGPVSVAVNTVTAAGVTYFSSAGNNNIISGGKNVSSFEAPAFRKASSCPVGLPVYATQCMDFNPGAGVDATYGIEVPAGHAVRLDLQWAQPWYGVSTDLDLYLLSSTNTLLASSENANLTTKKPFEFLYWPNTTGSTQFVNLAINRYTGMGGGNFGTPRLKFAFLENGDQSVVPTEYASSALGDIVGPTIFGHNGARNTMSAAAVPYDNSSVAESYSSRGPLTLYFAPVKGLTPAPALASPQMLAKPDIAATDGGANTFFGFYVGGAWRFYGTSAAAPHAAAVAALERHAKPTATVPAIKNAETSTARAVDSFGHTAVGAGLIDAAAAVDLLAPPNTLTVTKAGDGVGTVTSSPAGISCGSICAHAFAHGTSVTLTATPASGSIFAGWSGNCAGTATCTLTVNTSHSATATFEKLCIVPKVKGKKLKKAKKAIRKAHCSVGTVKKAFSHKVKKGRVISQKPRPGARRPPGAKVSLKVSKGKRH